MAQAFFLKTDVAMITSNASQKQVKNQAGDADSAKVESFSSALDKQVDKQAMPQHKKADEADNKLTKSGEKLETKTDASAEKSGKVLPDESVKASKSLEETDDDQTVLIAEAPLSLPEEEDNEAEEGAETETKVLSDDAVTTAINVGLKPDNIIDVDYHTASTLVGQAGVIKKNGLESVSNKIQVTDNSKLTADILLPNKVNAELTEQENESSEQKQQAPSLRSDILNALLKKPNAEGEKLAPTAEQKIVANSALIINKEGLTEEQKIMALANNVKLKGSSATGSLFERSGSVSPVLLTPASTNSNNAIASPTVTGQPTLNLQPALHSEAWSRVLSSRVIWMAREGVQQASLKLNPANMGPVEVKLHMHNEQANISFIAQHAATRDALEQALPRLRESFQENGMELAHADVSQEEFSQADEQDNNKTTSNSSASERDNLDTDIESVTDEVNITEQDIALGLSVFA
tara:strand:- start:19876 stop:21270 length:1395 start_codon:yes stop_codon:yes gene_type:complete